jgi:hypothetical protein
VDARRDEVAWAGEVDGGEWQRALTIDEQGLLIVEGWEPPCAEIDIIESIEFAGAVS